ncbi:hypothetical protein RvY_05035-2 [Ramazzottius varieornatus]|uniref:Charged multivesicular body protein 6 n=1 Tax=Ramazzottius varieornatus TaxID=947166 RepID=A0A1D1UX67_RAMVA|nr:hypothetical protein RvY_05035-2 [Ramazzottius varieornatus]
MGNLFGKSKHASRVMDHDRAVLELKGHRDKLWNLQKRVEKSMERDKNVARRLMQEGKRDKAKLMLRKKRFDEQMLAKYEAQLENLHSVISSIEWTHIQSQVLKDLETGKSTLQRINESINLNDVEKILDETREAADFQRQISDLLGGSMTSEDDRAVEEEFAQMFEDEELELPAAPTDEIAFGESGDRIPTEKARKADTGGRRERQPALAS